MAKPMSTAYPPRSGETAFQPEHLLADTKNTSPIQANESKMIVEVAEKIIRDSYADSLLRMALIGNRANITNYNGEFEADVDEPMTLESLAEQHKRFLAANQQDWEDVDLPSPFKGY